MRELTRDDIDAFLDDQTVGRMGCHDAGATYVVPLIFARERDALYVLTMEGRKVNVARANPAVCFEVDEYDGANGNWKSVIVQGRYEELSGEERTKAVAVLTRRHGTRRKASQATQGMAPTTVAFRIVIESATGRAVEREQIG